MHFDVLFPMAFYYMQHDRSKRHFLLQNRLDCSRYPSFYHLQIEVCNDAQFKRNKLFMLPMSISEKIKYFRHEIGMLLLPKREKE